MMEQETYLGDGLYASYDGYMLKLRAPRVGGDHWVCLEPDVLATLLVFLDMLKRRQRKESK